MNLLEQEMLEILKKFRQEYNVISIKSSFEDEGSRKDEIIRLLEISSKSNLDLSLKIGGCEAIRDLYDAKQLGIKFIVAPMIESSFALSKFIQALEKVFSDSEKERISCLFNIETITAINNIDNIFNYASKSAVFDGVVFGRDDYSSSLGLAKKHVEDQSITEAVALVSRLCCHHNLKFIVGGGITLSSIPNLQYFHDLFLTRFETRKIVFDASIISSNKLKKAIKDSIYFELLWLKNKSHYYKKIYKEDINRIRNLETIWSEY